MESRTPADPSSEVCPVNISAPKFHLFQSVTVDSEHYPYPADDGRIVGVVFDLDESLHCHWWYVVEYPEGLNSSPWIEPGYKNEVPESEITLRGLKVLDLR